MISTQNHYRTGMSIHKLLDRIFPPICFSCEQEGEYLCSACRKDLKPHPELCPFCHRVSPHYKTCLNCRSTYPALEWIIVTFQYTGVLKQLIRQLKYGHRTHLAWFLADRLALLLQTHLIYQHVLPPLWKGGLGRDLWPSTHNSNLIISFVPSHRSRKYFVKGYNQSELLAQHIGQGLWVSCKGLRCKKKRTRSQAKLSKQKRLSNLSNAFQLLQRKKSQTNVPPDKGEGTHDSGEGFCELTLLQWDETIIIVDDVTTTGSTLYELADTLKQTYPQAIIWWLVIGRHGR